MISWPDHWGLCSNVPRTKPWNKFWLDHTYQCKCTRKILVTPKIFLKSRFHCAEIGSFWPPPPTQIFTQYMNGPLDYCVKDKMIEVENLHLRSIPSNIFFLKLDPSLGFPWTFILFPHCNSYLQILGLFCFSDIYFFSLKCEWNWLI